VTQPPLKALHAQAVLSQTKISQFSRLSNDELIKSLEPGKPGSLKAREDGTVMDGHHRLQVLRDRGVDIDALPREVIPKKELL
jgi:hypothetical protein